ncbi:MAG: hypothetical protein A2X64_10550 [Ignavibacteria bacterium GWF2_33_9]|nr:MAG: hypothetical protein A2X64_10550 [Ignavibacteria bacterium GWF2_33_9]
MKKLSILFFAFAILTSVSTSKAEDTFHIYGFADTYFATDNYYVPQGSEYSYMRPIAMNNSKESTFGLNIAQLCIHGNYGDARGHVVLHFGEMASMASSAGGNSTIQQANVGFRIFDNFWVDAGLFTTHIGDEGFSPAHNWLSSYSIVTMNQPFFQSGVKFGYEGEKFTGQIHILNRNGDFEENNWNKTYGVYLAYKILENFTLSYGNLLGNENASAPKNPYFVMLHNVCFDWEAMENFAVKGEVDFGSQQFKDADAIDSDLGIAAQARYKFNDKCSATLRFAMLSMTEDDGSESTTNSMNQITLGAQYKPTKNTYFKLEGSMFSSDNENAFQHVDNETSGSMMELILNFGVFIK